MAAKAISSSTRRCRQARSAICFSSSISQDLRCIKFLSWKMETNGRAIECINCLHGGMPAGPALLVLGRLKPSIRESLGGSKCSDRGPPSRQLSDAGNRSSLAQRTAARSSPASELWRGLGETRAKGLGIWRCGREQTSSHGSWRRERGCLPLRLRWVHPRCKNTLSDAPSHSTAAAAAATAGEPAHSLVASAALHPLLAMLFCCGKRSRRLLQPICVLRCFTVS